jgi:transglutaminase-like putative cysteine protease
VSRREFRTPIDVPRPSAAFGMGAAATATLAITGEIALPVLAAGAGGLAIAALTRERPLAVQRNGPLLNALLALIAALSMTMWVRGAYSTVALAHFAILTQALQLLDARPRKSEFLLVALALFQVVLAANLTDSLLFPPLLVIFAVTAVWTLMVHTLRAEAIEAGEPQAARRALSRSLFTMTGAASLATIVIAVAIFPILPRVRSGALLSGGFGGGLALSGFSDRVTLGDIGRIRLDPSTALRVDTLEGSAPRPEDAYWRGLALDHFDGRGWSVTPDSREFVIGSSEVGVAVGFATQGLRLVQRLVREPVMSGVLFSAGRVLRVRGAVGRVERDANGGLYAFPTAGERIAYVATSAVELPSESMLEADQAEVPRGSGGRFLQLPTLSERVGAMAREVSAGLDTDAERVRAIERHLRQAGRYTDSPPAHGSEGFSPVESFLLDRTEGHCEYFASAMVVLLRSIGIPARIVNGFAGGEPNGILGFTELRQSDAHTWVEVHYADAGWVRYDPTPPDLRLAGAHALSAGDRLAELQSALEFWWFRNVIDFDRSRQAAALRGLWQAWHEWRDPKKSEAPRDERKPESGAGELPAPPLVWLVAPLAAFLAFQVWRQRRARRGVAPVPAYYRKALRLVARRLGARRAAGDTARGFARLAADGLAAEPAAAFAALTELYLAERFGGRPAAEAGPAALVRLRDSLRA